MNAGAAARKSTWSDKWRQASDGRRALCLACFCLVQFALVNWRHCPADVVPLTLVPVSLWRHGTVDLDVYRNAAAHMPAGQHFPFTDVDGHIYPRKPIFVSLLAAPLYLPPVVAGVPTEDVRFWIGWGRLSASLLTSVIVALCYLAARRWGSVEAATGFSLALALGTCLWTVLGQMIWDHLGAVLVVALLVLLLNEFPLRPGRAAAAGLLAGAAVCMRPPVVVLLLPLGVYLWFPGRLAGWPARLAALAGLLPLPLLNACWNRAVFGHWYSTGYPPGEVDRWTTPWREGAIGLWLAPNSGLLCQSPFLVLALVGTAAAWWRPVPGDRGLLRCYSVCFAAYWALFAGWHDWQGGLIFASRMLCEGYPLLVPLLLTGWHSVRSARLALPLTGLAIAWAVLYELVNIATFDAIAVFDPPHDPWNVTNHFVAVGIRRFGWATVLQAVAGTLGLFAVSVAVGVGVAILLQRRVAP